MSNREASRNLEIEYRTNAPLSIEEIIRVYDSSGLKRPTKDVERIRQMFDNSNFVMTAWLGERVIGISRALTDFSFCCYLSDLAVEKEYQKQGVGKELIRRTKEELGDEVMVLLLSAPAAMEYYPKIGMETVQNGFIINRKK